MNRKSGFTLLEILLALALVGMLFVALNTFIFSMGELWGRNSDVRIFNEHVNASTRFLGDMFATATFPPSARINSTPVAVVQVTPQSGTMDNLISFDLPAGTRLLNWPGPPLPEVVCSLQARPDGLYLLWQSRLETTFGSDPPRETLVTPFITQLLYDYYDDTAKAWNTQDAFNLDPTTSQPVLPQRLRLRFTYGKLTRDTTIPMPMTLQGLPYNF
jgi:prepilin-type N-terminal cleavage/methylation domain-containing protein